MFEFFDIPRFLDFLIVQIVNFRADNTSYLGIESYLANDSKLVNLKGGNSWLLSEG